MEELDEKEQERLKPLLVSTIVKKKKAKEVRISLNPLPYTALQYNAGWGDNKLKKSREIERWFARRRGKAKEIIIRHLFIDFFIFSSL
jgi:hypothetical protein